MTARGQQITSRGVAQESGLETFSSIINYTGEYVNWGNAFSYGVKLTTDTDYATETATPHIGALVGSPPSLINTWYRYHSSGVLYTSVAAPSSNSGWFIFPSIKTGGLPSYSGIYQKLSLTVGKEYKASIQTGYITDIGTLYFNTYTPDGDSYILTSTSSTVFPSSTVGYLGILTANFTAESPNDIILIYGTTEESSDAQSFLIQNISIKEKQEYLTPIYGNDMFDIAHKVLRVSVNQTINPDIDEV